MKRPNILILYTDQQRWDALGASGNPEIHTPHLDALAAAGVNFTHHFVQSPVCMPSRISMLAGQYPSTLGITHMGVPVPADALTLPRLLRPYGYRSASIGKLHFLPHASRDHRQPHPDYGFDHLEVADEPGVYEDAYRAWVRRQAPQQMDRISAGIPPAAHLWQRTMGIEDGVVHRGSPQGRHDFKAGIPFAADAHLTHTAFVAEQTIAFIEQQGRQPFLCIAGFYSPHAPWIVPQKYLDLYDAARLSVPAFPPGIDRRRPTAADEPFSDAQLRQAKRGYYAMVSEVDDYVGRIVAALTACGQRENTIIVFTSDHGEWLGSHLRYGKGYPADDAVSRVPLLVCAPEGWRGQHSGIVEAVDILPTLLTLAGIQPPPALQGSSRAAIVRGTDSANESAEDEAALTEGSGWKCLRTRDYRYLIHADGREALWQMADDPDGYLDLAADPQHQAALADCRRRLLKRLLAMERPLPRSWLY